VTASLHYGDNHTVTTDDPNELRDFAGVAAEMTLLRNEKLGKAKPVPDSPGLGPFVSTSGGDRESTWPQPEPHSYALVHC
jgi:hypothetical protein